MKGADYIATRRLTLREDVPKSPQHPDGNKWTVLAEEGQTCERIPERFLADCLRDGDIRPMAAEDNVRQADARRRKREPGPEVKE